MATQVAIEDLSDWLAEQSQNTASTPYEIEITGLKVSDFNTPNNNPIRTALLENTDKYVDLSATYLPIGITSLGDENIGGAFYECITLIASPFIPNGVTNLTRAYGNSGIIYPPLIPSSVTNVSSIFKGCTSLETAPVLPEGITNLDYSFSDTAITLPPVIPNTVTHMEGTFTYCENLTEAPEIPSGVTDIDYCFEGCTLLETVPNVPASVKGLFQAFKNCSALEEITVFEVDLDDIGDGVFAEECFSGCTSLTKIGVTNTEPSEASDWHIYSLKVGASNIQGKVYNRDGTTVTIPQTSITKDKIEFPVLTDELWFPTESDADIETIIQKMLNYHYGVFNKDTIDPDKKSFVLWADNPANFLTNIQTSGATAVCNTAGSEANKVADMNGYTLRNGNTFQITFKNSNTSASALTLSVGGTTAKPLYINNSASSASNYTLDSGTYLCRYNGTNYYIDRGYFVTTARTANSATTANYSRQGAYCTTDSDVAEKVASMTGYVLQSGATFPITFTKDNSATTQLTLVVNDKTAKPIYINNSASGASNYTLKAGTYLCRYNGTNYYIDTGYAVTQARTVGGYGVNNQTMTTQNDSLDALVTIAKKYAVGTSSSTKGYVQLGNNLKIQWGITATNVNMETVNLANGYLSFTNINSYTVFCTREKTTDFSSGGGVSSTSQFYKVSKSQFKIDQPKGSEIRTSWIAIGY